MSTDTNDTLIVKCGITNTNLFMEFIIINKNTNYQVIRLFNLVKSVQMEMLSDFIRKVTTASNFGSTMHL